MGFEKNKKGIIVVISGPSGVGKSTICKRILNDLGDTQLSVSVTTRPQTKSEVNGKDYWFVTKDEFEKKLKNGQLLEYANVFGNMYGTPKDKVEQMLSEGKTVILEIDVQGGKKVKDLYPDAVMIFIMPPTHSELEKRMVLRARDDSQTAKKRLDGSQEEIAAAKKYYEHHVVNDDLNQAVDEIKNIIERARSPKEDCVERKK